MTDSFEHSNEPFDSIKCGRISYLALELKASSEGLVVGLLVI
jgi:hypothetical protein